MPLDDKLRKTLLIRMDRIGDLILTIPVDQILCESPAQGAKPREVTWVISSGLEFVLQNANPKRSYFSSVKEFSFSIFFKFIKEVKKIAPQEAVIFHAPWWVSLALFLARVPVRAGKKSKWDSFLFLNKGVRQKRSESTKHEMHYNLDLLTESLGLPVSSFENLKALHLQSPLMDLQLKKWDLEKNKYIVVHPGMGGSALNWSMSSYAKFMELLRTKYKIVVTGSVVDKKYISELKSRVQQNSPLGKMQSDSVLWLDEKLNIQELFLILKNAKGVLAPSTGVIHMAASLGTPVLGLYSPRKVETALRWGPIGLDKSKVKTLTPDVSLNGLNSKENLDTSFNESVMEKLSPQFVAKEFLDLIEND